MVQVGGGCNHSKQQERAESYISRLDQRVLSRFRTHMVYRLKDDRLLENPGVVFPEGMRIFKSDGPRGVYLGPAQDFSLSFSSPT